MKFKKRFLSINYKITFFFSLGIISTALTIILISNHFSKELIQEEINRRFSVIAHDRQTAFTHFLRNKFQSIRLIASHTGKRRLVGKYLKSQVGKEEFLRQTQKMLGDSRKSTKDFISLSIINPSGLIISSTDKLVLGQDISDSIIFKEAKDKEFLDIPLQKGEKYVALLAAPLKYKKEYVGIVVGQINMTKFASFFTNHKELGESGEVLVGTFINKEINYVFQPRFINGNALSEQPNSLAMTYALLGKAGFLQTTDYRKKEVLAAYRPLKYHDWGMVVKIDTDEAYAPIKKLNFITLVITMAILTISIVGCYFLSRHFSRPISSLAEVTEKMIGGDYGVRASSYGNDEVSLLATSFNKMAESIQKQISDVNAANRAKSTFLTSMSHEIRTPMTAILGFTDLMSEEEDLPQSQRQAFLERISHNGKHLLSLINDILDLSQIEAGELKVHLSDILLADELIQLRSMLESKIMEKDLSFIIKSEGDVPETIETDPVRLRQILINIVGNAIKFTEEGGVTLTVKWDQERKEKSKLLFIVSDTGIGISEKKQGYLFQPFHQAMDNSLVHKYGGTGLGLVLSQRFARALGGNVELSHSMPGKGSTFVVTIDPGPVVSRVRDIREVVGKKEEDLFDSSYRPKQGILSGKIILLVEDNDDTQVMVSRILRNAGAKVVIAANGVEAEEKAMNAQYDVILMDIGLPFKNGYEVTKSLRKSGYQNAILAFTARAFSEEKEHALEAGCNDCLAKPISSQNLVKEITGWVSKDSGLTC